MTGQDVGYLELNNTHLIFHPPTPEAIKMCNLNLWTQLIETRLLRRDSNTHEESYLPVFLSALHELQAFVQLCRHLVNMCYGVDGPSVTWSHTEALHRRIQQFEARTRKGTDALCKMKSFILACDGFSIIFSSDPRVTATFINIQ